MLKDIYFCTWCLRRVVIWVILKIENKHVAIWSSSIHHLNRCQTITLCRGREPRQRVMVWHLTVRIYKFVRIYQIFVCMHINSIQAVAQMWFLYCLKYVYQSCFSYCMGWTISVIGKRRRSEANFPGAGRILQQLKDKPTRKRIGLVSTGPPARREFHSMFLVSYRYKVESRNWDYPWPRSKWP